MDLSTIWTWTSQLPYVDHVMFPSLVALTSFYVCCCAFSIWDYIHCRPELKDILRTCALPQIVTHVIVNLISLYVVDNIARIPRRVLPHDPPTAKQFAMELAMCYIVGDFLIYWEHRTMHYIPFLRRHVHSTHHRFTSPLFSWAAGYVHPIEIAIAITCEMAFPVLYNVHPLSMFVFIVTWVFWLTEEHSGHHFWWSLYELLFTYGGGSKPHDIHHAPLTTKNLAFVFTIWDHIFGTFVHPDKIEIGNLSRNSKVQ